MSAFDELTEKKGSAFDELTSQETPADSSPDNETPAGQEDTPEKVPDDLNKDTRPLHKDDRFKKLIDERNRLREEREELVREREELLARSQQIKSPEVTSKPSWFQKYFGDDEEAWQGIKQLTASDREAIKQEAVQALREESGRAEKEAKYWQSWVEEKMADLRETEGDFDDNELSDVMRRFKPTDEQGNLDFKAGLGILRLEKGTDQKLKSVAKKTLAGGLTSDKGKSEPKDDDGPITPEKLKKMGGWDFSQS